MMKFTQELSPALADRVLLKVDFESQKTDQPKPASAPSNLFAPVSGFDVVAGPSAAEGSAAFHLTGRRSIPSPCRGSPSEHLPRSSSLPFALAVLNPNRGSPTPLQH